MQTHSLVAHPAFMPEKIERVAVRWGRVGNERIMLRYRIDGAQALVLPKPAPPERADGLWKSTCCELFLSLGGGRYREFNFSPSGLWAAYDFSGYRTKACDYEPHSAPKITVDMGPRVFTLTVFLSSAEFDGISHAALSAVLAEPRRLSYWASRHPGLKPDFHDPTCLVLPVA